MRVGVQLPEIERVARWDEIRAMAVSIERLGFDSIWVGDHLLYEDEGHRRGPWEAWTQLAAIAAVTDRVTIGPLVAALPFHNPAVLAKQAATVDEISGGRLLLGVGAGWNQVEFEAFGLPFANRVARFGEEFEILRRLLAGQRVDFEGRFHTLAGAELLPAPRPGGPPLMIGSNGPRLLALTLPHVQGWNSWFTHFDNDPARLPPLLDQVDRICREVGRDPATVERTVTVLLQFGDAAERRSSHCPITGNAREMADRLARLRDLGIAHVQLVLDPITLETIERAFDVVDRLRATVSTLR